jgi:hypothetical protein
VAKLAPLAREHHNPKAATPNSASILVENGQKWFLTGFA